MQTKNWPKGSSAFVLWLSVTLLDHKMFFIIHSYKTEAFLWLVLKDYAAIIQNIILTFIDPKEQIHYFSSAVTNSSFPLCYPFLLLSMLAFISETDELSNRTSSDKNQSILKCLNKIPYLHIISPCRQTFRLIMQIAAWLNQASLNQ